MAPDLTKVVRDFALQELDFDLFGVTPASPLAGRDALRRYIAAGWHGEMAFMAQTMAQRQDPGRFFPGARSVICLAMSYHDSSVSHKVGLRQPSGLIARYAVRRDYHDVIRPRLVKLGRFLQRQIPRLRFRVAVDTAPVLEKELAQRAGLGWIGKNTLLINESLGSEMFLGEIILDIELPPSEPGANRCGECRRCVDTCPTKALVAPAQLDARRCISYLTIEHRDEIPPEFDRLVGMRVFGCDLCQIVCPFNQTAARPICGALEARGVLGELSPEKLLGLNWVEWRALGKQTPLRRLTQEQFARNKGVVLANTPLGD